MINYSYYRNYNSSKTIVLLHGWGVNSSYMESLKDFLLEDYSILLLDLPGHGKSYLNKVYKIEDYVVKSIDYYTKYLNRQRERESR